MKRTCFFPRFVVEDAHIVGGDFLHLVELQERLLCFLAAQISGFLEDLMVRRPSLVPKRGSGVYFVSELQGVAQPIRFLFQDNLS